MVGMDRFSSSVDCAHIGYCRGFEGGVGDHIANDCNTLHTKKNFKLSPLLSNHSCPLNHVDYSIQNGLTFS